MSSFASYPGECGVSDLFRSIKKITVVASGSDVFGCSYTSGFDDFNYARNIEYSVPTITWMRVELPSNFIGIAEGAISFVPNMGNTAMIVAGGPPPASNVTMAFLANKFWFTGDPCQNSLIRNLCENTNSFVVLPVELNLPTNPSGNEIQQTALPTIGGTNSFTESSSDVNSDPTNPREFDTTCVSGDLPNASYTLLITWRHNTDHSDPNYGKCQFFIFFEAQGWWEGGLFGTGTTTITEGGHTTVTTAPCGAGGTNLTDTFVFPPINPADIMGGHTLSMSIPSTDECGNSYDVVVSCTVTLSAS